MNLNNSNSTLHIPDGRPEESAIAATTHMAIGAHQDDLEIFAYHGILACLNDNTKSFGGVVATDGGGSARSGPFAEFTDEQMKAVRVKEQNTAADIGQFGFVAQLGYSSSSIKNPEDDSSVDDLEKLLLEANPEVLYLHNPMDKHDTHVALLEKCLRAVRRLPANKRPSYVLGCEVWRDLDWVPDALKVPLDVSGKPELAVELLAVFDSQVSGGKRYDLATEGRRLANATFYDSHSVDSCDRITFAVDMTNLFLSDTASLSDYADELITAFKEDVASRTGKFEGENEQ